MSSDNDSLDQADVESFFGLVEKNIGVSLDATKVY
jgi:hypothetical protein